MQPGQPEPTAYRVEESVVLLTLVDLFFQKLELMYEFGVPHAKIIALVLTISLTQRELCLKLFKDLYRY